MHTKKKFIKYVGTCYVYDCMNLCVTINSTQYTFKLNVNAQRHEEFCDTSHTQRGNVLIFSTRFYNKSQ